MGIKLDKLPEKARREALRQLESFAAKSRAMDYLRHGRTREEANVVPDACTMAELLDHATGKRKMAKPTQEGEPHSIVLAIDLPPCPRELNPNARVHWRAIRAASKNAKGASYFLMLSKQAPPAIGRVTLGLMFRFKAPYILDLDNALSTFKPYQDGIAEALKANDRNFRYDLLDWEPATEDGPGVTVTVKYLTIKAALATERT